MTRNIAIVTGASSGMGREFVLQIAAKYGKLDEIWAIARREELLWQLQGEAALPVRILTMDLAQEESIKPVSYTHLDVYKRQTSGRSSKYRTSFTGSIL